MTNIPSDKLLLWEHPKFSYYLVLFLSFGVFGINMIDPALIQRMLMAKSAHQLRQMFLTLAGLFVVLFGVFLLLGTIGHQLYPELVAADIVPHMIKALLPTGLRGLMMAGIIAVVMASADSYLHAAGLTLVHDVIKPLCAYRAMKLNQIRWVRYTTLLAGLILIILGLTSGKNLYELIFTSIEFATPILAFPFFTGILGLRPDRRAFYASAAVTLTTFIVGKLWLPEAYSHFLPIICVLASGLTFFTVHFARNHGFAIVRRDVTTSQSYVWQPRRQYFVHWLQQLIPTPRRLLHYSQKQVAKYGAPYILFGAFCCTNFTLPYFMWEHDTPAAYNLMLYLRVLGGLACGLLIVRDKWPASLEPYLPTFWHAALLHCLPFTSTVMFLLTQGSVEWLINVALTIMFLIVLVDWLSFLILSMLGVALGLLFYQLAIGPISLQLDFSTGYLLVYTCIFTTLIALLFARRREQHLEAKLREISAHYHAITQFTAADTPPAAFKIATMIERNVQEITYQYNIPMRLSTNPQQQKETSHRAVDCLQHFFPTALGVIQQGEQMTHQLVTALKEHYIVPELALYSLQASLEAILQAYSTKHIAYIQVTDSEDYEIHASLSHLQYVIIHILQFLEAHTSEKPIRLWITRQRGIHMRLTGQALSSAVLEKLCTLFPAQEKSKHLGLAISKLLVEAQSGRLYYEMQKVPQNSYTEFIITLPPTEETLNDEMAAV